MAGIRGVKNPFPTKEADAKGPFTQRGSGGPFMHKDVHSAALGGERKGPQKRNNMLRSNGGKSHYVNNGLKKGTSNRA